MASGCGRMFWPGMNALFNFPTVLRIGVWKSGGIEMGKDKTPKKVEVDEEEKEEDQVVLSVIASPLAKDKLVKKVLKLVKTGEP